ncbi:hypothetical protein [Bradyrhizobium shewense]|uniref:hypothetical protein n=1 Tax=Bradyrhizobium shewense TaxID=1761772 RepID=UPI00101AE458|nr:hypothetical protein [Bradyrhizobium shewense]
MKLPDIPKIAWAIVATALLMAMIRTFGRYYFFSRIVSCGYFYCDVEFSRNKAQRERGPPSL